MVRVLVTGSRDWDEESIIWDALAEQYHCWEHEECEFGEVVVVHGACPTGADAIADKVARYHGYKIETHPAEWDKHPGKSAGFVRNKEMVDAGADICLAFIKNNSRGATMTAELAEKAGIPVKRWGAS